MSAKQNTGNMNLFCPQLIVGGKVTSSLPWSPKNLDTTDQHPFNIVHIRSCRNTRIIKFCVFCVYESLSSDYLHWSLLKNLWILIGIWVKLSMKSILEAVLEYKMDTSHWSLCEKFFLVSLFWIIRFCSYLGEWWNGWRSFLSAVSILIGALTVRLVQFLMYNFYSLNF